MLLARLGDVAAAFGNRARGVYVGAASSRDYSLVRADRPIRPTTNPHYDATRGVGDM